MNELLATPKTCTALRQSVEAKISLLRELAFALRTADFDLFQKRIVNAAA